jgi:hypothetical protein
METRKNYLLRISMAIIITMVYLFNFCLVAQKPLGIYLSANDFITNKLFFVKNENRKCKIRLHDYSFNSKMKIICGHNIYKLCKDSVFGYLDWQGLPYRFYNKTNYLILNTDTNVVLYRHLVSSGSKYKDAVYSYHFSADISTSIFPLTINDLENCFKTNIEFVRMLEIYFKNDDELLQYYNLHNQYKINRLFQLSKNQK